MKKQKIITLELKDSKNFEMMKNVLSRLFKTEIENQINWQLDDEELGFVDKDNSRDRIKSECSYFIKQVEQ